MKNTKSIDPDLDWTLLFQAFNEAFEWALDVAAHFARKYPAELGAVERVRVFMRKQVAGQTAHVRIDDLLFVLGLIIGAIERDLGPTRMLRPTFAARRPALRANHTSRARIAA